MIQGTDSGPNDFEKDYSQFQSTTNSQTFNRYVDITFAGFIQNSTFRYGFLQVGSIPNVYSSTYTYL